VSKPGVAGGAFQRLELAPALVHGNDAALGLELGLDRRVFVFASDLADPAARVVANQDDDQLSVVAACSGEDREL
jgi:hypothetical protein